MCGSNSYETDVILELLAKHLHFVNEKEAHPSLLCILDTNLCSFKYSLNQNE